MYQYQGFSGGNLAQAMEEAANASKQYANLLASGQLKRAKDIPPYRGLAFNPLDPSTLYSTLPPTFQLPLPDGFNPATLPMNGYVVSGPAKYKWANSSTPVPWPGIDPPPVQAPDVMSTEEELAILNSTLNLPRPEPNFIQANAMPLLIGGSVLALGILGLVLLVTQ